MGKHVGCDKSTIHCIMLGMYVNIFVIFAVVYTAQFNSAKISKKSCFRTMNLLGHHPVSINSILTKTIHVFFTLSLWHFKFMYKVHEHMSKVLKCTDKVTFMTKHLVMYMYRVSHWHHVQVFSTLYPANSSDSCQPWK